MKKRIEALRDAKRSGLTLFELIAVLVILAVLASVTVPSLAGYIERERDKKLIQMTQLCVMAAQTLYDEGVAAGLITDLSASQYLIAPDEARRLYPRDWAGAGIYYRGTRLADAPECRIGENAVLGMVGLAQPVKQADGGYWTDYRTVHGHVYNCTVVDGKIETLTFMYSPTLNKDKPECTYRAHPPAGEEQFVIGKTGYYTDLM